MTEKIVVRFADIVGLKWENAKTLPFILKSDIEIADGYAEEKDKVARLVSAYMKRKYVGKWKADENGKPFSPEKRFNVSHTCGAVVFVSGDSDIGVDVEKVRAVKENIKPYISSDEEFRHIKDDASFFEIWTAKESLAKADGKGIGVKVNAVAALPLNGAKEYNGATYVTRCIRFGNYVLTVARKGAEPFVIEITNERLL